MTFSSCDALIHLSYKHATKHGWDFQCPVVIVRLSDFDFLDPDWRITWSRERHKHLEVTVPRVDTPSQEICRFRRQVEFHVIERFCVKAVRITTRSHAALNWYRESKIMICNTWFWTKWGVVSYRLSLALSFPHFLSPLPTISSILLSVLPYFVPWW